MLTKSAVSALAGGRLADMTDGELEIVIRRPA